MKSSYKYDVAISFAEEDRNAALALALALELQGFKNIYYYPKKRADGWGRKLKNTLTKIYSEEARYAVILFSNDYFKKSKVYTKIELDAIEKRVDRENTITYMLPIILSKKFSFELYPILQGLVYIKWEYDPEGIAIEIVELFALEISQSGSEEKKSLSTQKGRDNTIVNTGAYIKNQHINQVKGNLTVNKYKGKS